MLKKGYCPAFWVYIVQLTGKNQMLKNLGPRRHWMSYPYFRFINLPVGNIVPLLMDREMGPQFCDLVEMLVPEQSHKAIRLFDIKNNTNKEEAYLLGRFQRENDRYFFSINNGSDAVRVFIEKK